MTAPRKLLRRKPTPRDGMLAYIGLTSAEATLVDPRLETEPTEANCRVTVVPGRLLIAPHRAAARRGLEPQEYGWPAIAMLPIEGYRGEDTQVTPLLVDCSGQRATLYVELPATDLRWSLTESGFQVVEAPYSVVGRQSTGLRRVWVQEDLQPLLPVSSFAD